MQTNKLAQLIQAAAQNQLQETQWIRKLYQNRLKTLTETNNKYNEGKQFAFNENT